MKETFKNEIKDWYFNKRYFGENKKCEFDDVFYFLNPDLLVNFDTNSSQVRFLFKKTSISKVEEIISCLKKFRKTKQRRKPGISLLISSVMCIVFMCPRRWCHKFRSSHHEKLMMVLPYIVVVTWLYSMKKNFIYLFIILCFFVQQTFKDSCWLCKPMW